MSKKNRRNLSLGKDEFESEDLDSDDKEDEFSDEELEDEAASGVGDVDEEDEEGWEEDDEEEEEEDSAANSVASRVRMSLKEKEEMEEEDDEVVEEEEDESEEDDEVVEEEEDESEEDEEEDESEEEGEEICYYPVQNDFVDHTGETQKAGSLVKTQCKFCALWQKEWNGGVQCDFGKEINGNKCDLNSFSCHSHFWPLDIKEGLDDFLSFSPAELILLSEMRGGLKKLLGKTLGAKGWISYDEWIKAWLKKNPSEKTDAHEAYTNVLAFCIQFTHFDQLDYVDQLFDVYKKVARKKIVENRARNGKVVRFANGDMISWTDRTNGLKHTGTVMRKGGQKGTKKNQIRIFLTTEGHPNCGRYFVYMREEFMREYDPHFISAALPDVVVK